MATYSKQLLSGTAANGRNVKVAATATAGTLIHTAVAGASDLDEVWLYACNTGAADVKLTIEYDGTETHASVRVRGCGHRERGTQLSLVPRVTSGHFQLDSALSRLYSIYPTT